MKNLFVGIDISKEKLNLCYLKDLKTVLEEEVANDVKAIKKALRASCKALSVLSESMLSATLILLWQLVSFRCDSW